MNMTINSSSLLFILSLFLADVAYVTCCFSVSIATEETKQPEQPETKLPENLLPKKLKEQYFSAKNPESHSVVLAQLDLATLLTMNLWYMYNIREITTPLVWVFLFFGAFLVTFSSACDLLAPKC